MSYDTIERKLSTGGYSNTLPYRSMKKDSGANFAWRQREREIYVEFKDDVMAYLKAEKVPERYREKVFEKAWEDGHAEGYSEVFAHATQLAEIFYTSKD